ncbi:MAG: hypothetical protein R3F35_10590 [Myxococcota bacterium]
MKFALAKVEQWNLGLSAGAVAASFALETPHFATSLAAGALLEAVNLGALRRGAVQFFAGRMTRSWTGAFAFRFLALAAGIFLTLQAGAHPVALLIGLSLAMPAALIDAWLNRPPILDPATLPVLLGEELGEGLDEDAREAAELARRDERLSLLGRLFPTHVVPTGLVALEGAGTAPAPAASEAAGESPAVAEMNPDQTVRSGPDETRR